MLQTSHASTCVVSVVLQGFRSLLTDSQDASYLFNAVLDAVVDHTLPLVQVRMAEPRPARLCLRFCFF